MKLKVASDALNVRDEIIPSVKYGPTPGTAYRPSRVWFAVPRDTVVDVLQTIQDGKNTWVRVGIKQYMAKVYDDITYLV